jgi:hypothetical protein
MQLLNLLNPVTFYQALVKCWRNLANRRFYKSQMQSLKKDGSLKQLNMRLDMRSRAYYVLNLEAETLMAGADAFELERSRVFESISLRKPIFEKAELGELIEAKTERIKSSDYYAYLIQIKYRPTAKLNDYFYVLSWLACAAFLTYWVVRGVANYQEILNALGDFFNQK